MRNEFEKKTLPLSKWRLLELRVRVRVRFRVRVSSQLFSIITYYRSVVICHNIQFLALIKHMKPWVFTKPTEEICATRFLPGKTLLSSHADKLFAFTVTCAHGVK